MVEDARRLGENSDHLMVSTMTLQEIEIFLRDNVIGVHVVSDVFENHLYSDLRHGRQQQDEGIASVTMWVLPRFYYRDNMCHFPLFRIVLECQYGVYNVCQL